MPNNRTIRRCTMADKDLIFSFYDDAMAFQKTVFHQQWLGFEDSRVAQEIHNGQHWVVYQSDVAAAVFLTTDSDALFWGDKDRDPAVYLHRIVTHSTFRGQNFLATIIDWAADFCKNNHLDFIRLDTWGDNAKLIAYYESFGFHHYKTIVLDDISGLPKHYKGTLALLERPV